MDPFDHIELRILGHEPADRADDETPSCPPKIYVSLEEASLLRAMREIKDRAAVVRARLEGELADERRDELERQLENLRAKWAELSGRREIAYRRKMIMLGHLPPSALDR